MILSKRTTIITCSVILIFIIALYFVNYKKAIEIFFASDENYAKPLCVAITSILINADKNDNLNFYILDGGISNKSKNQIRKLQNIKKFRIEYIQVHDSIFEKLPISKYCNHVTKQTYYRYLIPIIKPMLKKTLYLDADIIVTGSLKELWNTDLKDNYVAAVEELHKTSVQDAKMYNLKYSFNAGVLLINNSLWIKDNITYKLFHNTLYLGKNNLLKINDQSAMNYTFGERVLYISPKYNLQQNAFFDGQHSHYNADEMKIAKEKPVIIHFNGDVKPWGKDKCMHEYANEYFKYLKLSPYRD